jgi:hypothetical protein
LHFINPVDVVVTFTYNIYWYLSSLNADCRITEQKPGEGTKKITFFQKGFGNATYREGINRGLNCEGYRNQPIGGKKGDTNIGPEFLKTANTKHFSHIPGLTVENWL